MANRRRRGARRGNRRRNQSSTAGQPGVGQLTGPITSGGTYKFTRWSTNSSLAIGAVDRGDFLSFALSNATGYTEYTALFDEYRIVQVDIMIYWNAAGATNRPLIWWAVDYDGPATAPASSDAVFQRQGARMKVFSETNPLVQFSVKRPGVLAASAASANAMFVRSPWLDVNDASEPHFGVATWEGAYNTTVPSGTLQYSARYHLEFRSPR